jgi:amino acid transporter
MKKNKNTLLVLLWTVLALSMLVVVLFETDVLEFGFYSSSSEQAEFLLTTMMELLTLVSIPVSLKLFKWKQIHTDLVRRKEKALLKWGILRLLLLLAPLFANTLLYYMYANVAFGYMAIILVIVLPFVYPSMERCIAETSDEE